MAIDFTDYPFYGDKAAPGIVGGKKKVWTNWHYRFAAITILKAHLRFTLAVYPVFPLDESVDLVDRLIT
ncbi:MAG: hypothetical protein ACFFD2_26250, partial [Promethearchaeota archaeon]